MTPAPRFAWTLCLLLCLPLAGGEPDVQRRPLERYTTTGLHWPAGPYSLGEICARLSAAGNTTMLRLGQSEEPRRELPAFDGSYWEGVLAVCAVFDLHVAPPPPPASSRTAGLHRGGAIEFFALNQIMVRQGRPSSSSAAAALGATRLRFEPVTLVPNGDGASVTEAANGPLLVSVHDLHLREARRLGGRQEWIELFVGIRCEPGMPRRYIHEAKVRWRSVHAGERRLKIGLPTDNLPLQFQRLDIWERQQLQALVAGEGVERGDRQQRAWLERWSGQLDPSRHLLVIDDPNRAGEDLRLRGEVELSLADTWERSCRVETDRPSTFAAGGQDYEVVLYSTLAPDDNSRERDKSRRLVLVHRGAKRLLAPPVVAIQGENGNALQSWGTSSNVGRNRQTYTYTFKHVAAGAYTVRIRGIELLRSTVLPIACRVPMP